MATVDFLAVSEGQWSWLLPSKNIITVAIENTIHNCHTGLQNTQREALLEKLMRSYLLL